MGIFDMFFKSSKKEEKVKSNDKLVVLAPLDGKILELKDVPDQTFAEGLLGIGLGIEPVQSGVVKAPISGEIVQFFETKHAFVIHGENDIEILVHFGLNTVKLNGEGFTALKKEGEKVKAGDPILEFDYDFLKSNADSIVTPIVVLEPENYSKVDVILSNEAKSGVTEIIEIKK